jgi:anti-sigma B factor antagonist
MAIKIDEHEDQGTTVLVVTGRIALTECQGDLKNAVRGLIERGRKQIVLDLEAVPFVDSAGLGELVSSYASVKRLGGSLRLTNVNQRVAHTLESAQLTSILQLIEVPRTAGSQPVITR